MKPKVAAVCNNCGHIHREGKGAYYDDKRELHYCNVSCFREWALDNVDTLIYDYQKENVERVDL
jgi:hypothetical protein